MNRKKTAENEREFFFIFCMISFFTAMQMTEIGYSHAHLMFCKHFISISEIRRR